jgi:hypothetical protein
VRTHAGDYDYRFVEVGFERVPAAKVAPTVFQSDYRMERGRSRALPEPAGSNEKPIVSPAGPMLSPAELAGLEVEALYKLHRIGACFESSSLTRSEGRLRIQAVVETESRKRQVVEALEGVARSSGVILEVNTVAEALEQQISMPARPAVARRVEIVGREFPVYADLEEYFARRLEGNSGASSAQLDTEIRAFSKRVMGHARQALVHGIALRRHSEEFSRSDLRNLNSGEEAKRHSILREHASALERETERLRLALETVFFSRLSSGRPGISGPASETDREKIIQRLFELVSEHERAVRMAFAVSAESPAVQVKTEQFRRSLVAAEILAARIEKPW